MGGPRRRPDRLRRDRTRNLLQGGAGAIVGSSVLGGALGGVLGAFAPNILDAFRARIDAETAAKALEGPEPTFVSANGAPSDLLHPRHAVARSQGRERELPQAW